VVCLIVGLLAVGICCVKRLCKIAEVDRAASDAVGTLEALRS
jgi:hypothetical protein